MSGLAITIDRSAEIHVDARIKITVEPPAAAAPTVKLSATFGGVTSTHTGASAIMYTLPADKQVRLQIQYVDANGNPAKVDGAVTWSSSDEDIARCEPRAPLHEDVPEGGAVMLIPGTKVGECQVSARADADLGEGMRELVSLLDVTVVGGEAVAGNITPVGEAVPKQ